MAIGSALCSRRRQRSLRPLDECLLLVSADDHPPECLGEECSNVVEMRRGVVVVVHKSVVVVPISCAFVDDHAQDLERKAPMMESAGDFSRRGAAKAVARMITNGANLLLWRISICEA